MASRLDLHNEFIDILGTKDEKLSRVYFQPPESVKMVYPAIRYSISGFDQIHASNFIYRMVPRYEVILIEQNPDSEFHDKIMARFPMCRFVRGYTADNLNHKVYEIYY